MQRKKYLYLILITNLWNASYAMQAPIYVPPLISALEQADVAEACSLLIKPETFINVSDPRVGETHGRMAPWFLIKAINAKLIKECDARRIFNLFIQRGLDYYSVTYYGVNVDRIICSLYNSFFLESFLNNYHRPFIFSISYAQDGAKIVYPKKPPLAYQNRVYRTWNVLVRVMDEPQSLYKIVFEGNTIRVMQEFQKGKPSLQISSRLYGEKFNLVLNEDGIPELQPLD